MNEAVMDEDTQNQSTWEPYVGRGALGGSIGMLVVVAIGTLYVLMRYGSHNLIEALVVAGLMAIISGVITGLAVGYMIYRIRLRRHAQLTRTEPFHPFLSLGMPWQSVVSQDYSLERRNRLLRLTLS